MAGYFIRKTLPSQLVLGHAKIFTVLSVVAFSGSIFMTLGILTKFKLIGAPDHFFYLFIGMGIIFTSGGIIFMIRKIPGRITFSRERSAVIFSENGQEYSLPYCSFSRFQVTGKISGSGNSRAITYRLDLVSDNGSDILLAESSGKTTLIKTAETIISYLDIDLLDGAELIHKGKGLYSPDSPVYPPREITCIEKFPGAESTIYRWNSRKSVITIFLLGAVIFGFNFLFFTLIFPAMERFDAGVYAAGFILLIIDLIFSATLAFSLFGTNTAEISFSGISYRQVIFGITLNSRSFGREEIGMISAGFTSEENRIILFTKRGKEIYDEMKIFAALNNLKDASVLFSLVGRIIEMRKNIIEIDGTPLFYYEKLYLVNEWSKALALA